MPPLQTCRTSARRFALLLVMLGLLVPGSAVAQRVGDVSIDVIVVWTAPFDERTDLHAVPEGSHETILSNQDDYVVVANGDFAPADARLAAFEALGADPGTLASVDAGTTGDPQYWLDLVAVAGEPYGAFTLARTVESGVTLTLFMGPVTTFAEGMAQAQAAVLVDGEPFFDGVEPAGLEALLEAALPQLDAGGAADDGASDDAEATGDAEEDVEATPDETGLVDEGTYVSPNHGFELTWTDAWILDPAYEEPTSTDEYLHFDQVHLTVNSPQWVWLNFGAGDMQGQSWSEQMDWVGSPQRLAQDIGDTAELVDSRTRINADGNPVGAQIIRVTLDGYDFVVYEEWQLSDDGDSLAVFQLLMLVDDVGPGLEATDDLEIDGGPVITLFTHDEILSVAQQASQL